MAEDHHVPAAQYLRMSTDQQQYSLANQSAAIAKYAECNGFQIVKTYQDAGRSGLTLAERPALRMLLNDVVNHEMQYKAILVYDVSRWGRFQDTDEAATYEFLCRTAGCPVVYCAEQFANDLSASSSILKALKRTMAAEFSRELGIKSYEGEKRLAQMGYKMGGLAGYGLRRMLLSRKGERIRILKRGEYKSVTNERVILVPGPRREVKTVRLIFELLLGGMRPASIVRELNRRCIPYDNKRTWGYYVVLGILRNQKYAGFNVWGQTSRKLHEKCRSIPRKDWITAPGAFAALINPKDFELAQKVLDDRTINKSDAELLEKLKRLLKKKKCLSQKLIDSSRMVPAMNTYYRRFGTLKNAYRLIGYKQWNQYSLRRDRAALTTRLRDEFIDKIAEMFPDRVVARNAPRKRRRTLLIDGTKDVSVYFCRACSRPSGAVCWRFDPIASEAQHAALVCLMRPGNRDIMRMYILRSVGPKFHYLFGQQSRWIKEAVPLGDLSELCDGMAELGIRSN